MKDILASLLALQQELREIDKLNSLAFFIAHQTKLVTHYQRAIVWSSYQKKNIVIRSISGIAQINKNSPYQLAANRFIYKLMTHDHQNAKVFITDRQDSSDLSSYWLDDLDQYCVAKYFFNDQNEIIGGMILLCTQQPDESQVNQLNWIAEAYNQSWKHLTKPNHVVTQIAHYFKHRKRRLTWLIMLAIILAMFIRVPQSVLAPASIIAKDPSIITVPMEGVIEHIKVKPEQAVNKGTVLFSMDQRDLLNANELAKKELATIIAKYKTAVQSSFEDIEERAEIKVLQAQMKEKELEVNYTNHLLEESNVRAPISGIVVLDNPNRWIGKPVVTGENVMQVATSSNIEIEIWLSVGDAINFKKGDKVKLFLDADPLNPLVAYIDYSSFEASITPSQVLAYQMIASIEPNQITPRIGSQGTAKLIGSKVSLFYYLFRKPITSFRQFFGW